MATNTPKPALSLPFKILTHRELVIPLENARVTCRLNDPDSNASYHTAFSLYVESSHPCFDYLVESATRTTNYLILSDMISSRAEVLCAQGNSRRTTLKVQFLMKRRLPMDSIRQRMIDLARGFIQLTIDKGAPQDA